MLYRIRHSNVHLFTFYLRSSSLINLLPDIVSIGSNATDRGAGSAATMMLLQSCFVCPAVAVVLLGRPTNGFICKLGQPQVVNHNANCNSGDDINLYPTSFEGADVTSLSARRDKRTSLFLQLDDEGETTESPVQVLFDTIKSDPTKSIYFSILMTLCGAALGPFLDSYHSLFGVLSYDTPLVFPILGSIGEGPALLTCVTTFWVPPLFGLAGFLIGW